ncbi:MAG: type 1 glutamine amidotransferase [bacterium]
MPDPLRFLIIDGYPKDSRDELEDAGMRLAWDLYADLLLQHVPDAQYDVLLPCDPGVGIPTKSDLDEYNGILWTGCNLTIYERDDQRVICQIELAKRAYEVGVPSFGSCWGIQMAAVAAGGEVGPNPKGREMGIARKIVLTPEGRNHPMFDGKPVVFDGFISHVDKVTTLPPGATRLAGNDFTSVQALAVKHRNGTFWATQYHPEYNLHEMARLIVARESKLVPLGFFKGHKDLMQLVDRMEALAAEPDRMDLRWQLAIDDDVLSDRIRQCEFVNWLDKLVCSGQ